MSNTLGTIRTKLLWKLLGCIVISGCIAGACAYGFTQIGYYYVENTFDNQEINRTFQLRYMENLQNYVNDNSISAANISELEAWAADNTYVYFSIYQNNRMIFNSDYVYADSGDYELETVEGEPDEAYEVDSDYMYRLNLADGTLASVDMFCYDYWNYNNYVLAASIVLGVLLFVIIFTRLVNRKLTYIHQLERELQILEGGNLEYPITVKGNDELGSLAKGIDEMRLSIIENNSKEQQLLQANKNLVTAMSHDLRTPLTTLTGYLELLSAGDVADEQKRKHYLELSVEKTHEIKELSDELFEYFLVYGEEQRHIDVESVPAYELVADLIENQFLGLEEEGYSISSTNLLDYDSGNCLINPQYMKRVLNNILSNLEKYADRESPIYIHCEIEADNLIISVRNAIRDNVSGYESTKIGLITCDRIMKLHQGQFLFYENEGEFVVKIIIKMGNITE